MTVSFFLILGVSCIAIAFIPKDQSILILVIFLIGRTGGSAGIQVQLIYTFAQVKPSQKYSKHLELGNHLELGKQQELGQDDYVSIVKSES